MNINTLHGRETVVDGRNGFSTYREMIERQRRLLICHQPQEAQFWRYFDRHYQSQFLRECFPDGDEE